MTNRFTYFVAFKAEDDNETIRNDVVHFDEITCEADLRSFENYIRDRWFGDFRELTIVSLSKLD